MGPCVARRALAAPSGAHLAAADARLASEALSRPTAQRGGGRCLLIPPVAATDSPPARGLTMPMHRRLVFLAISLRPSRGGQSCIVIGTHWPDPLVPVPAQARKSRLPRLAFRTPSHPVVSPDDRYAFRHSRKPSRGRCHSASSDDCSPYGQRNPVSRVGATRALSRHRRELTVTTPVFLAQEASRCPGNSLQQVR